MFTYMLMVAVVSMFISDAATVAMMIPIGMSVLHHVRGHDAVLRERTNFGTFITLGTLYAAVAGGTATMMGVPHNGIAVAMLERFTQRQLGFFEWMIVGVPVSLVGLVAMFLTLWILTKPELRELPGGEAFLRSERARLGPLSADEGGVLLVFVVMVLLFTLPAMASLTLGDAHRVTVAINRALSIWVVPPVVLFLLFGIRSAAEPGAGLLTWKDAEQRSPWNTMILVAAGVAMTDALTQFGFVELMGRAVGGLGVGPTLLPYLAATIVAFTTDFISGTAAATLYCSIFVPAAAQIGYNPASIAVLIANVAIGVALPWAGATSATAFAAGDVDMGRMVRIGVVATVVLVVVTATIHLILAPYL
jgi:sodium-dependent dicarboxylate transporter 2/3/5